LFRSYLHGDLYRTLSIGALQTGISKAT